MNYWILGLCLCVVLMGCASTKKTFDITYNEAVSSGQSVVIFKEGAMETLKDEVNHDLASLGYIKLIYSNDAGLMVLQKDINSWSAVLVEGKHSYEMMIKYTKIDEGKNRVDLVNGSTEPFTKDEIDRDIQKLAGLIKSS